MSPQVLTASSRPWKNNEGFKAETEKQPTDKLNLQLTVTSSDTQEMKLLKLKPDLAYPSP